MNSLSYFACNAIKKHNIKYDNESLDINSKYMLEEKFQFYLGFTNLNFPSKLTYIKYTGFVFQIPLVYHDIPKRINNPLLFFSAIWVNKLPKNQYESLHIDFSELFSPSCTSST